jgi:hypothetical protein
MSTRRPRVAVEAPRPVEARDGDAGGMAERAVLPRELEHRPRRRGPLMSLWSLIFLGLIALLLGILLGGMIQA